METNNNCLEVAEAVLRPSGAAESSRTDGALMGAGMIEFGEVLVVLLVWFTSATIASMILWLPGA